MKGGASNVVREGGLEPPRYKAQEPKSCVSANFTTRARTVRFLGSLPQGSDEVQNFMRRSAGQDTGGMKSTERADYFGSIPKSRRSLAT